MARQAQKKDVVTVGLGWTGAILGIELADEGLEILALERGADRDTVPDFKYPQVADELKYGVRYGFMQKPRNSTISIRRRLNETARPYRHLGSFLPGDGVGGAGIHWNGHTWRPMENEFSLRSYVEKNFGADIIPGNMTIQDWGVTYDELEPYFDRFEYAAGISGQAGNLNGEIIKGGNPFEAPRSRNYPMPPLAQTINGRMFEEPATAMGLHPFPRPAANASEAYVNEYGMQLGPCNYCGFCERYGCANYSKSSPQTCILDALKRKPNFSYRTNSEVLRVEMAGDGKTATGVTYWDEESREEVFQPADLVILAAYQLHNVHLMLLSGIGEPYDPVTGEGVTGKNYAYQNPHGRPLMRMTFDWKPNDIRMTQFMRRQIEPIAEAMNPTSWATSWASSYKDEGAEYDIRPYQTTHNVGGAILGTDPKASVLNRYLQVWGVHNIFSMGAGAFPQNIQYNPTGTVGALAYWAADAIRKDYLPDPRPLV